MARRNDAPAHPPAPPTSPEPLVNRVRALAEARGPHEKLPTHKELCERLGTRRFALDRALADLEARGILYRRQGSGIYVSPHLYRQRIAILLDASFFDPLGTSPFWAMLWGLFAHEAQQRSDTRNQEFTFYLVNTHAPSNAAEPTSGLPPVLVEAIREKRLQGALCIGMTRESAHWIEKHLPVVGFATGGLRRWVQIDHADLIEKGVACLAQRRGCRRVALWLPVAVNRRTESDTRREDAFLRARELYNLPTDADLLHYGVHPRNKSHEPEKTTRLGNQEQGFQAAMEVFGPDADPDRRPDGLLIGDDLMTSGALVAFEHLGILPGRDIQIASHANVGSCVLFGRQMDMDLLEIDPSEITAAALSQMDTLLSDAPGDERQGSIIRATWKARSEDFLRRNVTR